ncbi:ribosomal protein S18-alanine N-acetyltransferase [Paenirhodobacter sp. CAU 1674]|uniref:ribosomal protein S18-alanine N-acetyltransferase n=1 Tax=Paenirhodobacter sp. CAU 1674 TaxID=3032596 RepID=UPI0023DB867A|nr:ribosomal protein S18-alanine N-acetyltransferase [Paenirhodobacter sp. CAU 1674]MDF2140643.1 ribosomal protein S18-alanine N-acetyltransferase [Paenirhodobacter sp. CAU 1674]
MSPEALAALHKRCFTTPRPWSAAEFAEFLTAPLCFLQGDSQGFVLGRVIAGEAELLTICTAPEARRQGTGRALLAQFAATAQERGGESAFLEVAEDNTAARALYAAAGWRESGRRRGYYHTPEGARVDALVLTLPLRPAEV